jgi:hypothetical protein
MVTNEIALQVHDHVIRRRPYTTQDLNQALQITFLCSEGIGIWP